MIIPRSHPRRDSLLIRKRLVRGFESGVVAKEGLMAQGRGEAFDYLLGEKTTRPAARAARAAAAALALAKSPVISVNGNLAALCPKDVVRLARACGARLEVNLFYGDQKRRRAVARTLAENGAQEVLGTDSRRLKRLAGIDSARRRVDADGIWRADVVVVPLEDGDRTAALRAAGKQVITFDLNPLSRTAQTANITIVDNVTRGIGRLTASCRSISGRSTAALQKVLDGFDNAENLSESIDIIRANLTRRTAWSG